MAGFPNQNTQRQTRMLLWIAKNEDAPFEVKLWAFRQARRKKMDVPLQRLKEELGSKRFCLPILKKCAEFKAGSPNWGQWLVYIQLAYKGARGARSVIETYKELHRGLRELIPATSKRYRSALSKALKQISNAFREKSAGDEVFLQKLASAAGPVWSLVILHQDHDAPKDLSRTPEPVLDEIFRMTREGCPLRAAVFQEKARRAEAQGRLIDIFFDYPESGPQRTIIKERLLANSDLTGWLAYLRKGRINPRHWELIMEMVMTQMDREAEHTPDQLLSLRDMAKNSAPKGARLRTMLKKIDKRICKLAATCG
jgi:hypothetical protein